MVLSFLCPTNSWAFQRERRPQEVKSWRCRWCQRMKFRFLDHGRNNTKMISSGLEKQHMLAAPGTICLSKNELFWLKGPEKGVCDLDTVWHCFPSRLSRINPHHQTVSIPPFLKQENNGSEPSTLNSQCVVKREIEAGCYVHLLWRPSR